MTIGRVMHVEPGLVSERQLRPEVQRIEAKTLTETALVVRMWSTQKMSLYRVSQEIRSENRVEIAHGLD